MKRRIRVKSLAVIVRPEDHALLVTPGTNSTGGDYVRLPGGSIEFGESAASAVQREMREELGSAFESPRLLGVLENRFELDGEPGHEVLFVFRGTLSASSLYAESEIPILDVPGLSARWWKPDQALRSFPPAWRTSWRWRSARAGTVRAATPLDYRRRPTVAVTAAPTRRAMPTATAP